ncbi:MAG: peptidase [Proteobacteria bacterium]|nr:MAG: peptidase [Pseudomonadota bacterium]
MFANFIYFIVALLIYATYPPAEKTHFAPLDTLIFFVSLILLFHLFSKRQFSRLIPIHSVSQSYDTLDRRFTTALTRQSIMAVVLFAVDIYGLNMSSFFYGFRPFDAIPTLEALFFMLLFTGYLALVWFNAHAAYARIYHSVLSRKAYVVSNIQFSVPVLLPWLLLSGIADLILALPFELPRRVLTSSAGEVGYFFVFLIVLVIFAPLMVQKLWRCRPLESGFYRKRIETVCRQARVDYANILYWPIFGGRMITAGVMGLVSRFRYILVTDALLRSLDPDEVDAVIAHEIGHVKKYHLLYYILFLVGFSVVAFSTHNIIVYLIIISKPIYRFAFFTGLSVGTIVAGLQSLFMIVGFILYFRYIFGYFMRNFERQADTFVYRIFSSAGSLISTFQKIVDVSGQSADKPNWHHFSIRQRVDFLQRCERDRSWIVRHDRKVRISLQIYAVTMILLAIVGYQLNFGQTGKRMNDRFIEKAILNEIDRNGQGTAELYGMLGDLYFGRNRYEQAARAYRRALDLAPDSAIVLNNYAWMLATCEDPAHRNGTLALSLARRAADIEQTPHVMDTLAESLYVNGHIEAAIAAATIAQKLAKSNLTYYDGQLEKFRTVREKPLLE